MQIDLWNALCDCSKAVGSSWKKPIHIIFDLCEKHFTSEDGELYTTKYHWKERIAELLKANALYVALIGDLENIHTYPDLSVRMKEIVLSIPLGMDNWLLYEEKISPKSSFNDLVEKELQRKYSKAGARETSRTEYLRSAKKIVRKLGK